MIARNNIEYNTYKSKQTRNKEKTELSKIRFSVNKQIVCDREEMSFGLQWLFLVRNKSHNPARDCV